MPRRIPALLALTAALVAAAPTTASAAIDPLRTAQWALDAIHLGASRAAGAGGGNGALVAVLDSGVDLGHPDLAGRVIAGPDLVEGGRVHSDPFGHGTHLAGIIAAAAGNGLGGDGIAPAARILAIRVLDANNAGNADSLARGIDTAVAAGADVINLSLNWPEAASTAAAGPAVSAALARAAAADVAVVVAAGNDGMDACQEPARKDQTLCVGALDDDMTLSPYSSHGDGLGVVAPGTQLLSTSPGGNFKEMSGTSQAAAVASGVAALLAGQGLRGRAIVDRIERTARDLGASGYDDRFGFGLVDADRALDGASEGRVPPLLKLGVPASAKIASVRRKGVRVTCDAAKAGTCKVKLKAKGTVIASGSVRVSGAGAETVAVRPTARGRRLLAKGAKLRVAVAGGLTGAPGVRAAMTLRR